MDLDERKIRILEAIIDDYIKTAEPVGSRTLGKKYDMGISSATIRNEMADLEELGFLMQPHTSAGRVPSDKGYRLYVDEMLKKSKVPKGARNQIDNLFNKTYSSLDNFMRDLSELVSELTNYTVVVSKPQVATSLIKNVQLIAIDANTILLVTVINKNSVKNNVLKMSEPVTQEVLTAIAEILNEHLVGLTLKDINLELINSIKYELGKYKNILAPILDVVTEMINEHDSPEYYASGLTNIFNFPEFTDVNTAKKIIGLMENHSLLSTILDYETEGNDDNVLERQQTETSENINVVDKEEITKSDKNKNSVSIRIGQENKSPGIKDCSILTCKYELEDDFSGIISIIGPKRMNYENSISILNAIIKSMELKKREESSESE